jgi:hypothetical protein
MGNTELPSGSFERRLPINYSYNIERLNTKAEGTRRNQKEKGK